MSAGEKRIIGLYPGFKSSSHDPLHIRLLEKQHYTPVSYFDVHWCNDLTLLKRFYYSLMALLYMIPLRLKKDLRHSVIYRGYNIGHSLIETVIRNNKLGKFGYFSSDIHERLKLALRYVDSIEKYSKQENIGFIIGSDESFIYGSVLSQFAQKRNIRYLFFKDHTFFITGFKLSKNKLFAGPEFSNYKKTLREAHLDQEIYDFYKNEFLQIIHGQADYSYMRSTSYTGNLKKEVFQGAILLYLHDFMDSPGVYGESLFIDQWQWIMETVKVINKNNARFIIKIHPNVHVRNRPAIDLLKQKLKPFKNISFVEEPIRTIALKDFEVKGILTIFGSVILESAYFGINCISSGNHPFVEYGLSHNARSMEEYRDLVDRLCKSELPLLSHNEKDIIDAYVVHQVEMKKPEITRVLPYDDMSPELFIKLFGAEYSSAGTFGGNERRSIFLRHPITESYVNTVLDTELDNIINKVNFYAN